MSTHYLCFDIDELPNQSGWLDAQSLPVIAIGSETVGGQAADNADVILNSEKELAAVTSIIEHSPNAALALVQVLRMVDRLPVQQALTVESMAYATLQSGTEFKRWLDARDELPKLVSGSEEQGDAVVMQREGNILTAQLNRPQLRNSISVEMRDALVSLFELVLLDDSIERLILSGIGDCFSVGGELREFGLASDPAYAHWIRSVHNPSRLLAQIAPRVECHVHSACVGSGIEIPAFSDRVVAKPSSFFQLPELSMGLIPGAGGCVSISRRIGRQRTAYMALTGSRISARKALEWGLIDKIVAT